RREAARRRRRLAAVDPVLDMSSLAAPRPPYRAALAGTGLVLAGYVITLAPTVTFWDAGELIAASKTLGIPHPPGTPLFVLIAHVWGTLLPFGEYAVRTNLLSALFSATAAGFFFLVAHESLRGVAAGFGPESGRWLQIGGAGAAALLGAFTFTNWQNSNETEVYSVATFTIAAMAWLVHGWRRHRGTERAPRILLLVIYLAGVSIGNHLLALLAGPAVVMFLGVTLRREPAADPAVRRTEWGQVAVVAGVWALLIGTGLGSTTLTGLGALCFLGAAGFAMAGGAGGFAVASLAIAGVGVTPYLYAYLRSAQNPQINEAAPATLDALMAVIRRAQYPPRTPLDDPTVPHGPDNPGRTLTLFGLQLLNYVQYFDWQWARSLVSPLRTVVTLLFFALGFRGLLAQRRADRAGWWLLFTIFLATGLGLVVYMNFRPGFSLGYDRYPQPGDHEVRERDYFFVVSFIVWGIWAGMGAVALMRSALDHGGWLRRLAPALLLLPVAPLALNWEVASRRHGPDARLAADFAYNLLNSAPPYGILFTFGDNDTFPLWWAQEVEGIRRDVTIVCLALANTDWYMRQLRDNPVRPADRAALPAIWRDSLPPPPSWPLHAMNDSMVATALNGYLVSQPQQVRLGPLTRTLNPGALLYPNEIMSLSVIQRNVGRRPIVWAVTAGRSFTGLGEFVVQKGLGFQLQTSRPDTTDPDLDLRRLAGAPLDVPTTERLLWETYRYSSLLEDGAASLESTSASVSASLALPHVQLVYAYQQRGDRERMERALVRAEKLSPNPELRAALLGLLESTPAAPGAGPSVPGPSGPGPTGPGSP
ncbi:MAG: glycosyltransferase family 117 protein, partial [Gemmatimonadales bacterium]